MFWISIILQNHKSKCGLRKQNWQVFGETDKHTSDIKRNNVHSDSKHNRYMSVKRRHIINTFNIIFCNQILLLYQDSMILFIFYNA